MSKLLDSVIDDAVCRYEEVRAVGAKKAKALAVALAHLPDEDYELIALLEENKSLGDIGNADFSGQDVYDVIYTNLRILVGSKLLGVQTNV